MSLPAVCTYAALGRLLEAEEEPETDDDDVGRSAEVSFLFFYRLEGLCARAVEEVVEAVETLWVNFCLLSRPVVLDVGSAGGDATCFLFSVRPDELRVGRTGEEDGPGADEERTVVAVVSSTVGLGLSDLEGLADFLTGADMAPSGALGVALVFLMAEAPGSAQPTWGPPAKPGGRGFGP